MTIPTSSKDAQFDRYWEQLLQMADYSVQSVSTKTGSIAASNTYGSAVQLLGDGRALVIFSGTWTATTHIQIALSTATSPSTWFDIKSFTSNDTNVVEPKVACSLRVGVKTGNYTSGTLDWAIRTGGRP